MALLVFVSETSIGNPLVDPVLVGPVLIEPVLVEAVFVEPVLVNLHRWVSPHLLAHVGWAALVTLMTSESLKLQCSLLSNIGVLQVGTGRQTHTPDKAPRRVRMKPVR